jgi:uncharacterized protein (TIGR02147 family)
MNDSKLKELLLEELAIRKERNGSYSLRAFARDLGVSVTSLSEFLGGHRTLSKASLEKIVGALGISPLYIAPLAAGESLPPAVVLAEDEFRAISDWYSYAILSLARLRRNRSDVHWIAQRIGIPAPTARAALDRLVRMGFIEVDGRRLRRTPKPLHTTNAVPSQAIRDYHKRNLRLAERKIDEEPLSRRFLTSITMPTDPARLPMANAIISRFVDELCALVEDGNPSEIYTLAVQLFPLTKRSDV